MRQKSGESSCSIGHALGMFYRGIISGNCALIKFKHIYQGFFIPSIVDLKDEQFNDSNMVLIVNPIWVHNNLAHHPSQKTKPFYWILKNCSYPPRF